MAAIAAVSPISRIRGAVAGVDARQLGLLEIAGDVEAAGIHQRQDRAARRRHSRPVEAEVGDDAVHRAPAPRRVPG